jgi:4-coumarate--CoA ligase
VQEIIKVRGFQVAPAELEGHLVDHPEVADVCVVGIPDDFNGEVPFAFIVVEAKAAKRIKEDPPGIEKLKATLMKVYLARNL